MNSMQLKQKSNRAPNKYLSRSEIAELKRSVLKSLPDVFTPSEFKQEINKYLNGKSVGVTFHYSIMSTLLKNGIIAKAEYGRYYKNNNSKTTVTPDNEEKDYIRKMIATVFNEKRAKNIFSLIGEGAKMAKQLNKDIRVISAEKDSKVFRKQKVKYPMYTLNEGEAEEVLALYRNLDGAWLDFFGNWKVTPNLNAVKEAYNALKEGGHLYITSNHRYVHSHIKPENKNLELNDIGFSTVEKIYQYVNGRGRFDLFHCIK